MSDRYAPVMFSWHTRDPVGLTQQLLAPEVLSIPGSLQVDGDEIAPELINTSAINQYLLNCKYHVIANWESFNKLQISMERPDLVKWSGGTIENNANVFDWFETLSFDVCFGGKRFIDWPRQDTRSSQSLLPGHYPLGWLIAFKGEGHKYLISERWLEYAPVYVEKRGDLTLVQFHDLTADAEIALTQALPGWKSMELSERGGFMPRDLRPNEIINGQYDPEDNSLSVMVVGRDPSLLELQEACISRNFRGLADGSEIKKIIYTFSETERAERHIFDLWVRGIECHAFINGEEVNLTADYSPPEYVKPDWILRLQPGDEITAPLLKK